jgi:LysR family glycine cleavage system transcriptional activator
VRTLETYLARSLFSRKSNGLELTEVGEAYLPGVTEALNVAAAATEGLRGKNVPRTVTISAPVSFLTIWLSPRLSRFLAQNGNVEIKLNSAIWTDPNAELADVRIEVRDAAELDANMPHLACERLELVCAPALAARFATVPLHSALPGLRKIVIQGKHNIWQRWSAGMGIELDRDVPDLKVDNAVTALEAAAQGLGVAVAYSTYCEPYLASGQLATPAGTTLPIGLCHALTARPRQPAWHPAHKVFAWLKQEFEQ